MLALTFASRVLMFLIGVRGAYAVLLCAGVTACRLQIADVFPMHEAVVAQLMTLPLWHFAVWAIFAIGYATAAVFIVLGKRIALFIYAGAFATDFWLTMMWLEQPALERAFEGRAHIVEWGLNAFDLMVLTVLLLSGGRLVGARR